MKNCVLFSLHKIFSLYFLAYGIAIIPIIMCKCYVKYANIISLFINHLSHLSWIPFNTLQVLYGYVFEISNAVIHHLQRVTSAPFSV